MAVLALRWIFRKETEAKFPGFSTAIVEEWGWGQVINLGQSCPEAIAIGTLRGSLDEHEMVGYEDTCSAELFARAIGVQDDPAVKLMIQMVKKEDRLGAQDGNSIHSILKTIFRMSDKTRPAFRSILNWAAWAYIAEYKKLQQEILEAERSGRTASIRVVTTDRASLNIEKCFGPQRAKRWDVIPKRAKAERKEVTDRLFGQITADWSSKKPEMWKFFPMYSGGEFVRKVSVLVMDLQESCYMIPMAVRRMKEQNRPDIMVIRQPNGHVAIMSEFDFNFTEVARALRIQEIGHMLQKPIFSVEELGSVGNVMGWPKAEPIWHLHDKKPLNQLYCGAESTPGAPGTEVPINTIFNIIVDIIGGSFHPDHFRQCVRGRCVMQECPWFNLHMGRCLDASSRQAHAWKVRAFA